MLVRREAEAQAKLRVVLEERVRPGGATPLGILAPGCHGKIGAIDRRAARRIRDHHPVAKKLREQLEIRRLAATRAGAGEFEERLEELNAAHVREIDARAVVDGKLLEEPDIGALRRNERCLGLEIDRLDPGLDRAMCRAGLDAEAASRAVLHIKLQREADIGIAPRIDRCRLEAIGRAIEPGLVIIFGPDDAMGADEAALPALHAEIGAPDRHLVGDVSLLPRRGAGGKRAVNGHEAHRDLVAKTLEHPCGHLADEQRRVRGNRRRAIERAGRGSGSLSPRATGRACRPLP